MATAADIQPINKVINLIDPPKDLAIGGHLIPRTHGAQLTVLLKKTFLPESQYKTIEEFLKTKNIRTSYSPIGDKKKDIIGLVDSLYFRAGEGNRILNIVREKHSTGHDARADLPSGYFLAQDCGPMDVVKNPVIIHTPGSILDPAGKTKGPETQLLLEGSYATLPFSPNLENLGLGSCLDGPITITTSGPTYTITIPTKIMKPDGTKVTVLGQFNTTTFKPVEGDPFSIYFQGNNEKNKFIADNINDPAREYEIQLMILMKELGDTLQVEWLNLIFAVDASASEKPIHTRDNTLMATSDKVVCYRSIVNNVGAVYTNGAKTTIYLSADAVSQAAIQRRFIDTVRVELISANESIIQSIENAMNSPRDGKIWINGQTWSEEQYGSAIQFLQGVIAQLTAKNADLNTSLQLATVDLATAKQTAAANRFQSPFVLSKTSEFYKTINSVIKPFSGAAFRPTAFSSGKTGPPIQVGGAVNRRYLNTDPIGRYIQQKVVDEMRLVTGTDYTLNRIVTQIDRKTVSYPKRVFLDNITPRVPVNELFLFIYVREFFPAIFNLGKIMARAMGDPIPDTCTDTAFPECLGKLWETCLATSEEGTKDYYYWNKNNKLFTEYTYNAAIKIQSYNYTIKCIKYANLFCQVYPQLQTKELADFFSIFFYGNVGFNGQAFQLERAPMEADGSSIIPTEQYGGGGGGIPTKMTDAQWSMYLDVVSTVAMDLYEQYFYLQMRAAYEDKDSIDEYLEEREEIIRHYQQTLTDDDYLLKYELQLFQDDYKRITGKYYMDNSAFTRTNTTAYNSIPRVKQSYIHARRFRKTRQNRKGRQSQRKTRNVRR